MYGVELNSLGSQIGNEVGPCGLDPFQNKLRAMYQLIHILPTSIDVKMSSVSVREM